MEEIIASQLPDLASARAIKLSSMLLCHAQRIITTFCLIITNQQSTDSGDFIARKF